VARCLVIGCGCRGRSLARELRGSGHAVRGTTRDPSHCADIEAAGAEAFVGDPDRVATLVAALEHVAVTYVLLGSATGGPEHLADLHGTRLDMLLERSLDTTVRGIVYEASGSVDPDVLRAGAERVRKACLRSSIPYLMLDVDPSDHAAWLSAATGAVDRVLGASGV
jgi:nucleoside-diphosphate-sugar epimerase